MRPPRYIALLALSLISSLALAGDSAAREKKIKTGILPTGGFYSLYEVACPDNSTVTIASMEGRTRWCTVSGGDLSCYRMPEQATYRACDYLRLAAADLSPGRAAQ